MTAFTDEVVQVGPRLRGLVHDLRQPIAALTVIGDVLLGRDDISAEAQRWIRLMVDQGQMMFELCRSFEDALEELS